MVMGLKLRLSLGSFLACLPTVGHSRTKLMYMIWTRGSIGVTETYTSTCQLTFIKVQIMYMQIYLKLFLQKEFGVKLGRKLLDLLSH